MLRWLFNKIFKKNPIILYYISPILQVWLCYQTFSAHQSGSARVIFITHIFTIVVAVVSLFINFRRFFLILQKPYNRANIHVVISILFIIITTFATIYSLIYVSVPNAFAGFSDTSSLSKAVDVVYFSATTFTTLGLGDIHPASPIAKIFVSAEAISFVVLFSILLSNHQAFFKPQKQLAPNQEPIETA